MSRVLKFVPACEVIPKWFGLAYRAHYADGGYFALIPLNFFIGWAVAIWWRLQRGPARNYVDRVRSYSYQQGWEAGERSGYDRGVRLTINCLKGTLWDE